jgi:hypothetical protein
MKCLNLILVLAFALVRGAHLPRLNAYAKFNTHKLREVYFGCLPESERNAEAEATRMETITAWVNGAGLQNQCYLRILWELMDVGRLEDFRLLFPLLFLESSYYLEFMECAISEDRPAFAEYVMTQDCYKPANFHCDFYELLNDRTYPSGPLDLLIWMMEKDPRLAEQKASICYMAMRVILENGSIEEGEPLRSARRLVELGLVVDYELLKLCRFCYNNEVCHFLKSTMIPDVKQPEC